MIPIHAIINTARLDANNMNSELNRTKLKNALQEMLELGMILEEDILNGNIDYNNAPKWIAEAIENERQSIVHEIRIKEREL